MSRAAPDRSAACEFEHLVPVALGQTGWPMLRRPPLVGSWWSIIAMAAPRPRGETGARLPPCCRGNVGPTGLSVNRLQGAGHAARSLAGLIISSLVRSSTSRSAVLALSCLLLLPAPFAAASPGDAPGARRFFGPAVDVDLGASRASGGHGWGFFARGGAGLFVLDDLRYASVTASYSHAEWQPGAVGLAANYVRIASGLGFTAGAHYSTRSVFGLQAGGSFSLLHLEGQLELGGARTKALVIHLRVPVGLLLSGAVTRLRAAPPAAVPQRAWAMNGNGRNFEVFAPPGPWDSIR